MKPTFNSLAQIAETLDYCSKNVLDFCDPKADLNKAKICIGVADTLNQIVNVLRKSEADKESSI